MGSVFRVGQGAEAAQGLGGTEIEERLGPRFVEA